jgi:polyisoprenoid-binding protein YceI
MSDAGASTQTRTVEGVQVPTAGTFEIDPVHSHVGFSVRHMMVAKVRGRFTSVSGTIQVADDPTASSVEVDIDAASIDTRDDTRDGHLRSPDFLDVETYPKLTFRSAGVTVKGTGSFAVPGELTIHGVTRPVELEVTYEGMNPKDPFGMQRLGFTAETEIDREDFGLTWNQVLETGGVMVGKNVKIELEIEAVRPAA